MSLAQAVIDIHPDAISTAKAVANMLLAHALSASGDYNVSLSGGSTPQLLYQILAAAPYREKFPWDKVHWFWGDERYVPKDNQLSNFKMINDIMLSHCPVPKENIHAVNTTFLDPYSAAHDYQEHLQHHYGANHLRSDKPFFQFTLLGMGPDGHTASLFPNSPVLEETKQWCCAVVGAKPEARITMTYPLLNSSEIATFLVTSAEKKPVLTKIFSGDQSLPASRVSPIGKLYWFIDEEAKPDV